MSEPEGDEPEVEDASYSEEEAAEQEDFPVPAKILEHVPPEYRQEVLRSVRRYAARYSGPVPHAAEMARYKEVDPSFPERFVAMAERQAVHRQSLETRVVTEDFAMRRRGQHYALISIVILLAFALALALLGATTAAAIVGGTTVVGVVTVFVTGRVIEASAAKNPAGGDGGGSS